MMFTEYVQSMRSRPCRAERGSEMPPRKQQTLFESAKVDETRVRIKGTLRVPSSEALTIGDTVEIGVVGHVVEVAFSQHESGLLVREHLIAIDNSKVGGMPAPDEASEDGEGQ